MTPGSVCPGRAAVLAVPPAFLRPQDGQDQQAGARGGGKRWIEHSAKQVAPQGVPFRGDDLYSHHPLCQLALHHGCTCIFGCTPDSHTTLDERLAWWPERPAITAVERRRRRGRVTAGLRYRSIHEGCLRSGQGALAVNGCELPSVHAQTGAQLSHHSVITHPPITEDNVADLAQAGRGRGKSANANHHVLKTKGEHIAHHFGHGKQSRAAFRLSLNLLAWLFHTVLEWCDDKYALMRQVLARRQTFCDALRALTRYMVCDSWQHLMDFMSRGLELAASLEAKRETKLDTG